MVHWVANIGILNGVTEIYGRYWDSGVWHRYPVKDTWTLDDCTEI